MFLASSTARWILSVISGEVARSFSEPRRERGTNPDCDHTSSGHPGGQRLRRRAGTAPSPKAQASRAPSAVKSALPSPLVTMLASKASPIPACLHGMVLAQRTKDHRVGEQTCGLSCAGFARAG